MTATSIGEDTAVPAAPVGRNPYLLRTVLIAVTLALVAAGVIFLIRAGDERNSGAAANHAVIDTTTTNAVIGQVSTALNQVLSYSYTAPQTAQRAAAQWLAGDAVGQYKDLFVQLNERAPGQKLSFVAKVITAGVTTLKGNTASLLVFLDQESTRASDHESSVAAAQVQITAVRHGSLWRITELQPL
jgi:Mce-associated membrane protein